MASTWRTVRVFISSTFRDMHAERDHLVKVVFPALRERLEKHRVYLIDIDLRWGVTREQAENDQALDVCLDQIDACRPFFVGILGERYGWVSTKLPERVASKYGWIRHHAGKSITELEIVYGVLQNPQMRRHAFFYFRDPDALLAVPEAIRRTVYCETEPEQTAKLHDLKERIRRSGFPLLDGYPARWDPKAYDRPSRSQGRLVGLEAFGQRVHDQLWQAIQAELQLPDQPPDETAADPLAEEQDYHERFMDSRLRVYVGREQINDALLAFADGNDSVPCLVTGPSGSGKSAALARFVRDYQRRQPQTLVLPHFVGASPRSTNLRDMLRRFCQVFKAHFGFTEEVPEEVAQLSVTFCEFVDKVPTDTRVLLVIDALNQLDEADRAQELYWLPSELPPQVKVIGSCITDSGKTEPVLEAFRWRKYCPVELAALSDEEQRLIISEVPSLSAKTLDDDQVRLLLSNPATTNPLFLLVALEELRGFAPYERLNERIAAFPRVGDTVTAIFTQVIERLAEEFNQKLVETVLTLLASARRGLSERELQELVASLDGADDVFPVLRQLRPYLLSRAGLIDFYHRNLFKAVRERYLRSEEQQRQSHQRLAQHFRAELSRFDPTMKQADFSRYSRDLHTTPLFDGVPDNLEWEELVRIRKGAQGLKRYTDLAGMLLYGIPCLPRPNIVEELPWQLAQAGMWKELHELLSNLPFFKVAWMLNRSDVTTSWARLEANSAFRMEDAYAQVVADPQVFSNYANDVGRFFLEVGRSEAARKLYVAFATRGDTAAEPQSNPATLINWAVAEVQRGHNEKGLSLLHEAEALSRRSGDKVSLSNCLNNCGGVLHEMGKYEEAMLVLGEAESLYRELGDTEGLQAALGNRAAILSAQGDLDDAFRIHREKADICRSLGHKKGLAISLHNQAGILRKQGDTGEAEQCALEAEKLCREIGDAEGVEMAARMLAQIQRKTDAFREVIDSSQRPQESESTARDKTETVNEVLQRAAEHYANREAGPALDLFRQAEQLYEEMEDSEGVAVCLLNQANVYFAVSQFDRALHAYRSAEMVFRHMGLLKRAAGASKRQAEVLLAQGAFDDAMTLLRNLEQECRREELPEVLVFALAVQGTIMAQRQEFRGAMAKLKGAEQLARDLDDKFTLAGVLGTQGDILLKDCRPEAALDRFQEEESLHREAGNLKCLAESLVNQAAGSVLAGNEESGRRKLNEAQEIAKCSGLPQLQSKVQSLLSILK